MNEQNRTAKSCPVSFIFHVLRSMFDEDRNIFSPLVLKQEGLDVRVRSELLHYQTCISVICRM